MGDRDLVHALVREAAGEDDIPRHAARPPPVLVDRRTHVEVGGNEVHRRTARCRALTHQDVAAGMEEGWEGMSEETKWWRAHVVGVVGRGQLGGCNGGDGMMVFVGV